MNGSARRGLLSAFASPIAATKHPATIMLTTVPANGTALIIAAHAALATALTVPISTIRSISVCCLLPFFIP